MKIKEVIANNKKKAFEVRTHKGLFYFPYSRLNVQPASSNKIKDLYVDREIGNEGFTYELELGQRDTIHIDQVLEYNRDSDYLREILLYELTLEAQRLLGTKEINKREVIRRLNTSATQFYRLLDQAFYNKTIDQMVKLLAALDCETQLVFKKVA